MGSVFTIFRSVSEQPHPLPQLANLELAARNSQLEAQSSMLYVIKMSSVEYNTQGCRQVLPAVKIGGRSDSAPDFLETGA
jgi:hypothetical protein